MFYCWFYFSCNSGSFVFAMQMLRGKYLPNIFWNRFRDILQHVGKFCGSDKNYTYIFVFGASLGCSLGYC